MKDFNVGKLGTKKFHLPLDAVTQKAAFLGRTGSGKTYAATKLAEEMYRAGAQIIPIDAVGVWWGLRLGKDGKSAGIDIPVFGGLRGDIPLAPTAGKLIADLVVERRLSVILDISQFETDAEKARFASDFADRFFWLKKARPSPVHLFLEECQELVPQNLQRGEEQMLHRWTRLAKLGRNYGIGLSLISQRPQEVNKKALNMTELLFAFQMRGKQERSTVRDWLSAKGGADAIELLPSLKVGSALVSSPQWLEVEGTVQIGAKSTYDSSSTPSFEDLAREESRALAPLDLAELEQAMAATIEEAKANDPTALKRRVAELEAELRRAGDGDAEDRAYAEVEERDRHVMAALKVQREQLLEQVRPLLVAARDLGKIGDLVAELVGTADQVEEDLQDDDGDVELIDAGDSVPRVTPRARPADLAARRAPAPQAVRSVSAPARVPRAAAGEVELGGPHRRILGAIAWLEAIGIAPADNVAVAFLAGYRPSGGAFNNPKGALRTMGLIDYPMAGTIELTAAGRAVAEAPEVPRQLRAFHAMVLAKLPGPEQRILRPLLERYPEGMDVQALAEASGYSQGGGAFNNPKGRLRTLGLIDYPRQGWAVARDVLFPRGLR